MRNVITFPVIWQENTNSYSNAYGKYYAKPKYPQTLDLRGLIERVAFDQSVYSRDIIEGVVIKLTRVMVEQLEVAQPISWDGLGTFTPHIETYNPVDPATGKAQVGGITEDQLMSGDFNIDELIGGVHIRFTPIGEKNENLTSRALADLCSFEVLGVGDAEQYVKMEAWLADKTAPADVAVTIGTDEVTKGSAVSGVTAKAISATMKFKYKGTYGIGFMNSATGKVTEVLDTETVADDNSGGTPVSFSAASATASATKNRLVIFKGSSASDAKIMVDWCGVSAS